MEPSWSTHDSGLFSDKPHLLLKEAFWNDDQKTASNRYIVIDSLSGDVQIYGATYQAHTNEEYIALLESCGFKDIEIHTSLDGIKDGTKDDLIMITAVKG